MVVARRPIFPNLDNCSLAELEVAATAAVSKRSHIRLKATKALPLGIDHDQVSALYSITRRCLFGWVKQFNEQGIDGLIERLRPGRTPKINAAQSAYYRKLIQKPELAEQVHWTGTKFHGYLRQELQHEIGYRTVIRWLHANNFQLKGPQSWPNRQDET